MVTLYGYTILADLAVLAILVGIFVFAASIYKGAFEFSAKEEEATLNRRKELINTRRQELAGKMKGIDDSAFPKEIREGLDNLNTEIKTIDRSIAKSRNRAKALTVRNMVAIPGLFLVLSIIASASAIATSGIAPTITWSLSLALLVTSLCFICRNLCAVEFFSGILDLSTMMEQALDRHRMKSTPIVDIDIWDFLLETEREQMQAITIEQGQTRDITYDVSLKQGTIGRNTRVRFSGTEEIDFPEEEIKQFEVDYKSMRKPKQFWHDFGNVNPKEYKKQEFKLKAPDQPGEYTMAYWIQCDEYTSEEKTFIIKVV